MKLRVLTLVLLAAACGNKSSSSKQAPASAKPIVQPKDIPDGLDLKLSDGKQGAPAYDKSKLAAAKKLGDGDVAQILARAEALKVDPDDQQAFALRPMSQPPPRTGNTIKDTFPADPKSLLPPKPTQQGKDLQVLRYMPEGEVPLAPELTVTFNQPMVAVTSQDDAAKTKPVKLTPEPKGRWRWIGTRTILFDPEVRFPQATTYKISIPAGTKSATGETLEKEVAFSFETPTPKLIGHYPDEYQPQHTDVPMFVMFDQKIDPQAVLAKIQVRVPGPAQQQGSANDPWKGAQTTPMHTVAIKALDDKEIAASHAIKSLVDSANKEPDRRWVAFRTTEPLPTDASITVEIPAGTPSAEGPNLTKEAQTYTFHTYPPFKFVEGTCGYQNEPCPPGAAMSMIFNNPVDQDKLDENLVTVTPEVPGMKVVSSGNVVSIVGLAKARTDYKVTVAKGLIDEFEQKLDKDATHTFKFGDAYPTFYGPSGMVVLDPAGTKPTLDFFSTNYDSLKVRIYKVGPSDLQGYYRYQSEQWNKDHPPPIPGTKVFDGMVKTKDAKNELVETQIDLAPALTKSGYGHAIVIVEPSPWKQDWDPPRMIAWVQSTKLAVDAHVDNENLLAFATDLAAGKPVEGVSLEIRPTGTTGTTDAQGLATLPLGNSSRQTNVLVARKGEDVALLTENDGYWGDYGSWYKQGRSKQLAWYVIDDRKLYKPGEEVSLKGWLRQIDYGKQGDVLGIEGGVSKVSYRVTDNMGNEIAKGSASVNPAGGWDTKFTLPKTPNLGYANVALTTEGRIVSYYSHGIQIEEFRRPEFEVSARASTGPFMIGGGGDVTVSAKYFAGGALPGADVNWYVTASATSFTPPNRDDYTFGQWVPWWGYRAWYDDDGRQAYKPQPSWNHQSKTDAMGEHVLHMDFLSAKPSVPMSVTANASVQDVNRQAWTASQSIIVHPAAYYVGVKTKRPFVEKGTPFDLDVIVVDIEGKAIPGAKVDVKSVRLDWEYKKGKYETKEVDEQHCAVVATKDAVPCHFNTKNGGSYQLTAIVTDDQGRQNQTKMTYWVSGGENPPSREVAQEVAQLIPDKKEYTPGNTAEIMVQAPFYPAEGIVTWRRSGIVKTERITLQGPTASLKVPITDDLVPNLYVQVDLVGMATRTDDAGVPDPKLPKRPAYAVGTIDLPIPPKQRTLAVTATPAAAKLAPAEETTIALEVKDANGKPVEGAEAAVIVVDESVLTLAGYSAPNPIDSFYPQRGTDTRDYYERAYVKLAQPDLSKLAQAGPGGTIGTGRYGTIGRGAGTGTGYGVGGGKGAYRAKAKVDGFADVSGAEGDMPMPVAAAAPMEEMEKKAEAPPPKASMNRRDSAIADARSAGLLGATDKDAAFAPPPPVAIRTNFNALAAFSPSVKTGADGKAIVPVKMPDNLTRYRVIAVAAAGDKQFGKGESAITARLPLMVRPSPPRFLNFGDAFQLPVVVQNQTDSPMTVRLAARVGNARLTDGAGREITVPANDRMEVQFPAAADMAGTARFQIVGVAGNASDAANIELPVWTPTTTEAFATYGVIDEGAIAQPVQLPGKVWPQFGGLEVTTASTNLQALTDAVIYLVHYPFDCAEQRSSRIMALASLRDVLAAFKSKDLPSTAAMEHSVDVDLEHLTQMQNYDGGFVYWERGYPSEPYLSVFVMQALYKAKSHGYSVPANMYERGKYFLREIESHYPYWYDKETRDAISAYALYVRKQIGDPDTNKTKALYASSGAPEKVAMEVNGWLLSSLAGSNLATTERAAIVRYAMNHVSETAGAANFTTSYGDGKYVLLASDRRTDGVMLEALIQEQKNNDLIPKIVTGLLAHRKKGHWLNTQENAFVLTALELYFKTYEKVTPNFVARMWLGNDFAGDHAFKGRTTEYYQVAIAMKDVATHDKQNLTIQKDGAGRLYYRIGMTYAPEDLKVPAADYGFVVERKYEGVDDPKDVTRDAQGTWHFKAGARIRVKLSLVNENRRYMVALVDPMPAGIEPMNPALATTGPIPQSPAQPDDDQGGRGRYWWWYGPWYEHQNMRDERVEAFASLLWEGVHKYEYVARATTPGNFVVPPPKAEEMYMPETFGRGDSDRVIVE